MKGLTGKTCVNDGNHTEQEETSNQQEDGNHESNSLGSIKLPRYIPPALPERVIAGPVRGELHWVKKKLIVGNISRWIPVAERDDTASHKWMVWHFPFLACDNLAKIKCDGVITFHLKLNKIG